MFSTIRDKINNMKTRNIFLPVAALLISAVAFAQKSQNHGHRNAQPGPAERREVARTNGVVNANAHASERAQQRAAGNSVLNRDYTAIKTKHKTKVKRSEADKKQYGQRKKNG